MTDDPYLALRARVAMGVSAQALLEDDVLSSVLATVEHDAIVRWRTAQGPTQLPTREHAHATVTGIDAIRNQLRVLIDDADLARAEMEELDVSDEGS